MTTSQEGVQFIKKWEQLRLKPYQDSKGIWTIGYGHTKKVNSNTPEITPLQARELLIQDIYDAEKGIRATFDDLQLRQCQYDALVSFVFNIGIGNFRQSKACELMSTDPDDKRIADSWITWRNSGHKYLRGLMLRRIEELKMYYGW